MLQDLRYTLRAIAKRPSFAIGTMLVLGLAVGVNTAVFSLLNLLLLRPLPVHAPGRARVHLSQRRDAPSGLVTARIATCAAARQTCSRDLAARGGDGGRLRAGARRHPVTGRGGDAELLRRDRGRCRRSAGRSRDDENSAGASPVAVISDALWKSHFASDPNVLGRTLRIDADSPSSGTYSAWKDYTIVGVMPPSFTGTGNAWQPARYWVLIEPRFADVRAAWRMRLDQRPVVPIGRLKPGVTLAQARSAVEAAASDILRRSSAPHDTRPDVSHRRGAAVHAAVPGRVHHGHSADHRHARRRRHDPALHRRRQSRGHAARPWHGTRRPRSPSASVSGSGGSAWCGTFSWKA